MSIDTDQSKKKEAMMGGRAAGTLAAAARATSEEDGESPKKSDSEVLREMGDEEHDEGIDRPDWGIPD